MELLENFKNDLVCKGLRLRTAIASQNLVKRFLVWAENENMDYQSIVYNDILSFVKYCKDAGNVAHTINMKLIAINKFYLYLIAQGIAILNPVAELRIRGTVYRKPHNLLEWDELEVLYQKYPMASLTGKRNKAILGMLVYQGLQLGELQKLMVDDVDLITGKLTVPALARSNSRVLNLDPVQILQLQNYATQVRPVLIGGQKVDQFFVSSGKSLFLNNVMAQITKQLISIKGDKISCRQIKPSVITHWLSKYNIREVQYMAGHRYLSSTEHYRTDVLESLQDQIDTLHPLN